jgi:hypothetical protein
MARSTMRAWGFSKPPVSLTLLMRVKKISYDVALQFLQFKLNPVEILHLVLAGLPVGPQLLLVALGHAVLVADARHHLTHLRGQGLVRGAQVGARRDHLRVPRAIAFGQLRDLALCRRLLTLQFPDQLVLEHRRDGHQFFRAGAAHALHAFLDMLRLDARPGCLLQALRQRAQFVTAQAGDPFDIDETLPVTEVLQRLLRIPQVLPQYIQPLTQPASGLQGALEPVLEVAVDELLGNRVDHVRCQLRIGGLIAEVNDIAVLYR